jgi:hypothetical protein
MIARLRADESVQVLVFIVLPLLLLFGGMAIRWLFTPSRYRATFPTFWVSIVMVGHGGRTPRYVVFHEENRDVEFTASTTRDGILRVQTPGRLPEQELFRIVPKLAMALEKMRYRYVIFRQREPQKAAGQKLLTGSWELQENIEVLARGK